jgi:hypothetical protein
VQRLRGKGVSSLVIKRLSAEIPEIVFSEVSAFQTVEKCTLRCLSFCCQSRLQRGKFSPWRSTEELFDEGHAQEPRQPGTWNAGGTRKSSREVAEKAVVTGHEKSRGKGIFLLTIHNSDALNGSVASRSIKKSVYLNIIVQIACGCCGRLRLKSVPGRPNVVAAGCKEIDAPAGMAPISWLTSRSGPQMLNNRLLPC